VCFCDTWEVLKVEVYARVRRAVQADGMSVRRAVLAPDQIARAFSLERQLANVDRIFERVFG